MSMFLDLQLLMKLSSHSQSSCPAFFVPQDFDDDGVSECVGFTLSEISIFTTADNVDNLLVGEYGVPEDFLKIFSRYNFNQYCLGVLFTNRAFEELVLGLRQVGTKRANGPLLQKLEFSTFAVGAATPRRTGSAECARTE